MADPDHAAAPYRVLLYYLYTPIADPEDYAERHLDLCRRLDLRGRILIAAEGINGTCSGTAEATGAYIEAMRADPATAAMEFKIDTADGHTFKKLFVRHRPELVTLGLEDDIDPNRLTGSRLSPKEFREALAAAAGDPGTVVLDGRNEYESRIGRFEGAICPDIENFRDFPGWLAAHRQALEGKRILTYCTGGIRCEKLSGLLLREGFENVFQLHGGIVTYGKDPEVRGEGFEGQCYVFDERIAVEVNAADPSIVSHCIRCGEASARYVNCEVDPCHERIILCESCEQVTGRCCLACAPLLKRNPFRFVDRLGSEAASTRRSMAPRGQIVEEETAFSLEPVDLLLIVIGSDTIQRYTFYSSVLEAQSQSTIANMGSANLAHLTRFLKNPRSATVKPLREILICPQIAS
ncbi:MAG: rhodanese-related sulfurtransferase [Verrucomicrobiales bacterium]